MTAKRIISLVLTICMMLTIATFPAMAATTTDGLVYSISDSEVTIADYTATASTTEYTITYQLDGGTNAAKNPEVYTSEDVITLKDATKEGYDFTGWFLDATKTEQISEISNRTGNLNLYAKFSPKSYTATFKDGVTLTLKVAGKDDKEIYVPYGTTIDLYSAEFMGEYAYLSSIYTECSYLDPYFSGWYADENYNIKIESGDSFSITSDTTIYGNYNHKNSDDVPDWVSSYRGVVSMFAGKTKNTIDCEGGGNTYVRVPTLSTGEFYVQCSITLGYSSSHASMYVWNLTKDEEVRSLSVSYGDYGKTYYGTRILYQADPGDILRIYSTCTASVTFDSPKRATSMMTARKTINKTVAYDQQCDVPSPTPKYGYNFLGWFDKNRNEITNTWKYTANQTFTAKWQPTNYYITYNLDGGSNSTSNPLTYTIEDNITLADPTKQGYTFKGWYSDPNFTTRVTKISKQTGNITLYAKYEENSYNLTLDGNTGVWAPKVTFISDGVVIKNGYLYEQNSITAYRSDNKSGYIFAGWYLDNSFTNLFKFNGTITDDVTLYAKWIECSDNIINIESMGSFDVSTSGKTEQLYAFVPLVDGTIVVTSASDGLDLYGILYDSSKSALISADDISDNDLDFSYTYDVKAGQLYYIAVRGATASTSGKATINVDWKGSCTITGTTYPNRQVTVVYDTDYKLPAKPKREGFVFLGWFDENGNQITDGTWNFVTDKTLTAKWDVATQHSIVFKDSDGEIISTLDCWLGDDIIAPEFPSKAPDHIGSYSAKWDNNYTGVCTGDAVYTVVFVIDEYVDYTVTFKNWDGSVISEQTYHYGDAVVAPNTPQNPSDENCCYVFVGWDKLVTNCYGDAVYTAKFTTSHEYDNACDADCNLCGDTRTVGDHVYDNAYDPDCNECGETREVADLNTPTFVVENKTAKVGETFTVDVSIKNNSGIVGLRTYVGYDADVLELVSIAAGEYFSDTTFGPLTNNPISILWDDSLASSNNTTNGVVATLTFKVREGAETCNTEITLTYDPEDVYDENFDNVEFAVENGTIAVIEYISGDVNSDGLVNNKDLGVLRRFLNDWDVTIDELASDVNRDGNVNNKDLGILRRYLNDWDVELK